jgi:DNA-binding XRE family transcriptional regulator
VPEVNIFEQYQLAIRIPFRGDCKIHKGVVALAFWKMTVKYQIPLTTIELDDYSHIGLHIRKKRQELKLRQEDLAKLLDTHVDAVYGWEAGLSKPQMQCCPRVIQFLGYNPFPFETQTLAGRIKLYRLLNGLSHKKMGELAGVNGSTISCWENQKYEPDRPTRKRLEAVLKS